MEDSYPELYGVCSSQVQSWVAPFLHSSQSNDMQAAWYKQEGRSMGRKGSFCGGAEDSLPARIN